jgi:tetratricopeptide (TPR) repeat protein
MDKGFNRHRGFWVCVSLTVVILAVFWQVRNNEFVNFDDGKYVTENRYVQDGLTWDGFVWAFTTTHANFWHPLTWLSHMLDGELYGLNPAGHHFTNLLLHIANTLLLFLVLRRMTGALWRSAFVAALFALHPLHVESVAWASERKDVLSTLFWILTMGAYVSYAKSPELKRYLLVLLSFTLGLMAKPMLVTLPFVFLLLDYWPFARLQFKPLADSRAEQVEEPNKINYQGERVVRLLVEKVPLLVFAAASSIMAFFAQQHGGAAKSFASFPMEVRVANALVSYVSYMAKMLWPKNLAVFYPHPGNTVTVWQTALAGLLLLSLCVFVIRLAKGHPYLCVGWLWYLGTLVPVIGLVQVGDHGMADRYTYVPLIGLFIMIAWGLPDLLARWPHRKIVLATSAAGLLSAFMICSWLQVRHWQNSITLFEQTLHVTAKSPLAHTNLGVALGAQGKLDKAIWHYSQALRIKSNYLEARINLGGALARQGKLDEAIGHYLEALRIKPGFADAHYNLGNAVARQGKMGKAIAHYSEALRIEPDDAEMHNNLGIALAARERTADAVAHFREALRIKPDFAEARHNLALALQKAGNPSDASH